MRFLLLVARRSGERVCCGSRFDALSEMRRELFGANGVAQLRLGNEINRARFQSLKDALALAQTATDDKGHGRVLHRPAQDAEAVHLRHLQIEHDDIRPPVLNHTDALAPVRRQSHNLQTIRRRENLRQPQAIQRRIIHD